jgi:DNA-binding response OmpR family regulator
MKVLLIEDEPEIALFVKKGLEAMFFSVDTANEGKQGEYLAKINDYDIVILDYNLPDKNGIEICKSLRIAGKTYPIIMLTAEGAIEKKLEAFDCGANDYITKPFAIEELIARINAFLRNNSSSDEKVLHYEDLELDASKYLAKRAGKILNLRKKEFSLLEYFMLNTDIVLTRSMILEHVWETNADPFTNTVDVHITTLRQKLNEGFTKKYITTVRGMGYKL